MIPIPSIKWWAVLTLLANVMSVLAATGDSAPARKTVVSIVGEDFHLNGRPTYPGRNWRGHRIEGLLLNARMVQGIFDDLNPETVSRWAYPDTGKWDADRNTREFVAAMPAWRRHGLLAFTLNLQGGSPQARRLPSQGSSRGQPWNNSAFDEAGSLRPEYLDRLGRILQRADELGMVVILGYFYFAQDQRLVDEAAVVRATDNITAWLLDGGWTNLIIEINNECNAPPYDHAILKPDRVHELIERVRRTTRGNRRLLVSTSFGGGTVPQERVVRASDFVLLHGNDVDDPKGIAEMVRQTRALPGYRAMPILFNEDDHFSFDSPRNNFTTAIGERAGWGYYDQRKSDEGFAEGFQGVPVDWSIGSDRKRGFFQLLREITNEYPQ